jgi:hypothetical protein
MKITDRGVQIMDVLKVVLMMIGCCTIVGLSMQFPHGGVLLLCLGLLFSFYDGMKPDSDSSYI